MTDPARKREYDRDRKRRLRAGMTPEERADARREHDRKYRERHRQERRNYSRDYEANRRKSTRATRAADSPTQEGIS